MKPSCLITGAAGFIGASACEYYRDRFEVTSVDNFSRPGVPEVPQGRGIYKIDAAQIPDLFQRCFDVVLHLAAQVSVVASVSNPGYDFTNNARLTMELARWASHGRVGRVIYASTNKVYGELRGRTTPVEDGAPINPQTPYGISKACGGLYVREFLPETGYVFNQSCIYGEGQTFHASEDQGWIGYLMKRIGQGQPITCYGDGHQVRDLLHVSDLLRAYDLAIDSKIEPGSYTVGGGPENAVSFREAVSLLGGAIQDCREMRPHDQAYFVAVSDGLRKAGWRPEVDARTWLRTHALVRTNAVV